MARKPPGGNGTDQMLRALLSIESRLDRGFAELRTELQGLRGETHAGFERLDARIDQTNERLDKVIENTGKYWRELERRVSALEDDIARMKQP